MDSLTQVVLGAAVSVAVMRRRSAVWKAALWGGVAGTLPDLDVLVSHGDPILNMVLHRAESHALFWLTLFSLPFAWLVARVQRDAVQLRWWWLAIIVPLVLLLGLLGLWAVRRSGGSDRRTEGDGGPFDRGFESGHGRDFGQRSSDGETGSGHWPGDDSHAKGTAGWPGSTTPAEFEADEDAIDTAPTKVPTESDLATFGEPVSVTEVPRWPADFDSGRHARSQAEDAAPLWQTYGEDAERPRRRHAADDATSWAEVVEEVDVVVGDEGDEVEAPAPAPAPAERPGFPSAPKFGDPEPWRPAIHLPLADPYEAPEGYVIKATTHSGLYYLPDSALYDNTLPEVWFASEDLAQANGFIKAPK